jgi:excisionase family DNA binding protein
MSRTTSEEIGTHGEDGLLTAEEVATILHVTPAWVYAETRRKRIPHVRLGRYVRYRRVALMGWLDEMERASAPPLHRPAVREASASARRLHLS